MTKNQIDWAIAVETKRHDLAMEQQQAKELAETQRHQSAMDTETAKHNRAYENITFTHNVATEQETRRSNLAQEGIKQTSNAIQLQHNLATEEIAKGELAEKERHQLATEKQAQEELREQSTHNRATEYTADLNYRETARTNRAKEEETHRANVEQENIAWDAQSSKNLLNMTNAEKASAEVEYNKARARYTNTLNEYYSTELLLKGIDTGSKAVGNMSKVLEETNKIYQNTMNNVD